MPADQRSPSVLKENLKFRRSSKIQLQNKEEGKTGKEKKAMARKTKAHEEEVCVLPIPKVAPIPGLYSSRSRWTPQHVVVLEVPFGLGRWVMRI
jgi:hypothetical protein